MGIKKIYTNYSNVLDKLKDFSPLIFRLLLAYGFAEPAWNKLQDVHAIGDWFASMELPAPYLQAWMATITECSGVILLTLGLGTRIIAIPLIITMLVAIKTVHWANGFPAADNGYEIPFYYALMLLSLIFTGSGKISLDYVFSKNKN
ncbi:MAG TPA: DoxX family protein [Bacteroidia bacterium]|jgi:putative oxidoreductase|nr:DoxX family protein [Bacteroidia bacterium]